MINAVVIVLMAILSIISAVHLFFKYISPKEKKELNLQRDKLFKDVEKLLKKGDKESILQVIKTFESLEEISDKLGDFGLVSELRERSNNLRRQLGMETKGEIGAPIEEINKFIQQLMKGPYGKGTTIELAASVSEGQAPQVEVRTQPKSLLEEGAEILARLRNIRGEEAEENPSALFTPAQPVSSEASAMGISNSEGAPPGINLPPPIMPPRASQPPSSIPPPMAPPPSAVPRTPPPGPPMAPPATPPRAPVIGPPAAPSRPVAPPVQTPTILPPPAPPVKATSKTPLPFSAPPPPPARPMAIPIQGPAEASSSYTSAIPLPETPLPGLTEEPQLIQVSEPAGGITEQKIGAPSLKDEKSEILARLNRELPKLPESEKGPILDELMKRPAGKLRDTWFKIIVHKNKQYAGQ